MERKQNMWTRDTHKLAGKPSDLVAAVFFDQTSARDAIADLKLARFQPDQVAVAVPEYRKQDAPLDTKGKHSMLWKLRHSFENDLQSQGADVSSEKSLSRAHAGNPPYTEIDLVESLSAMGVARDTIKLLEDRMGEDGLLILVHAPERLDEVESILVQNRGMLRTVMATQPSSTTIRS
jgi:hypothetical protein